MTERYSGSEKKTRAVVILSAVTAAVEIIMGYWTHSMALLADGYHMLSHVLALGLSWIAYVIIRKQASFYSFHHTKVLALSGYSSAVILLLVAVTMGIESVKSFLSPEKIRFGEAIAVAFTGLVVNGISAIVLHQSAREKEQNRDYNLQAAYLHVLADGLTSIIAIVALAAGMLLHWYFLDALGGMAGSVIIFRWALRLLIQTAKELVEWEKLT